jgi:hypothetical protein
MDSWCFCQKKGVFGSRRYHELEKDETCHAFASANGMLPLHYAAAWRANSAEGSPTKGQVAIQVESTFGKLNQKPGWQRSVAAVAYAYIWTVGSLARQFRRGASN